jgi:hypothetical protein
MQHATFNTIFDMIDSAIHNIICNTTFNTSQHVTSQHSTVEYETKTSLSDGESHLPPTWGKIVNIG